MADDAAAPRAKDIEEEAQLTEEDVDGLRGTSSDWAGRMRRITVVLALSLFSGSIGSLYGTIFYPEANGDEWRGFRTGMSIGLIASLIEVYYIRAMRDTWIRRVAFLPGLLVRIIVLTLIVRICLVGNELFSDYLLGKPLKFDVTNREQIRDTIISMGLVVVFVVVSQFTTLIGFRRFMNLVLGRYFRPVEEDRLFVFIDLVDSTRLARRLGDVGFHEFLAKFFHIVDSPISAAGGEIVSYVGDSVIVTWPLGKDGKRNSRCLRALAEIERVVERMGPQFRRQFGVAPQFRAAIHGGTVVVGECGSTRRQVTFLGDVVNITSRIEHLAKVEEQAMLISDDILARMSLTGRVRATSLGPRTFKGTDHPIDLSVIEFV